MIRSFLIAFLFMFAITVFCIKERPWQRVSKGNCNAPDDFKEFQKQYLIILGLVQSADWLQGPYVYALYEHYNFSIEQIAQLFVVGYGAAGFWGVIAGAIADKLGRKKACFAYTVIFGAACVTKHFPIYRLLLVGRLLAGISAALLHTAFESWMVSHHKANNWSEDLLENTFTQSGQVKGTTAVIAGVVAATAVDIIGPVAPFDVALVVLAISSYFISRIEENDEKGTENILQSACEGLSFLWKNTTVLALGLSQSFFEAGMFMFVFVWTPSLQAVKYTTDKINFGYVFSSFMVGCILGSTLYGILIARGTTPEVLGFYNFLVALATMVASTLPNFYTRFFSFVTFEICVGCFWANAMSMRGKYIPGELRTTIMNLFRVPLNIMVVTIMLDVKHLSVERVLLCSSGCIALATCCQLVVLRRKEYLNDTLIKLGLTSDA